KGPGRLETARRAPLRAPRRPGRAAVAPPGACLNSHAAPDAWPRPVVGSRSAAAWPRARCAPAARRGDAVLRRPGAAPPVPERAEREARRWLARRASRGPKPVLEDRAPAAPALHRCSAGAPRRGGCALHRRVPPRWRSIGPVPRDAGSA
ncbi:unnamed protein product, partial [Phaeothamnion confervicola]